MQVSSPEMYVTSHSWDGSRAQTHLSSNLVLGQPAKRVNSYDSWEKNEPGSLSRRTLWV